MATITEAEVKAKPTTRKKAVSKTTPKVAEKTVAKTVSKVAPKPMVKEAAAVRYLYAIGRRKTAVAQVRLYPVATPEVAVVNQKSIHEYFGMATLETASLSPLKAVGLENAFRVTVVVRGSGKHSQAGAIRLGVARALLKHDIALRPLLKASGFLTRDARAVERKKPGLKKARRAPQWAKR